MKVRVGVVTTKACFLITRLVAALFLSGVRGSDDDDDDVVVVVVVVVVAVVVAVEVTS
jgi:hypothetical protein